MTRLLIIALQGHEECCYWKSKSEGKICSEPNYTKVC